MANLGTSTDLSLFPGDYVAFGFSAQQLFSFQYGIKEDFVYVGAGHDHAGHHHSGRLDRC